MKDSTHGESAHGKSVRGGEYTRRSTACTEESTHGGVSTEAYCDGVRSACLGAGTQVRIRWQ